MANPLVKQFMKEHGYTNVVSDAGIRKNYLGGTIDTCVIPEKMLQQFFTWMKRNNRLK